MFKVTKLLFEAVYNKKNLYKAYRFSAWLLLSPQTFNQVVGPNFFKYRDYLRFIPTNPDKIAI